MIGNWFEHMKEVKKDEQWLFLLLFFFSSLSAMRHFRRIFLNCIDTIIVAIDSGILFNPKTVIQGGIYSVKF